MNFENSNKRKSETKEITLVTLSHRGKRLLNKEHRLKWDEEFGDNTERDMNVFIVLDKKYKLQLGNFDYCPKIMLQDNSEVFVVREKHQDCQIYTFCRMVSGKKLQEEREVFIPWDKDTLFDVFEGLQVQKDITESDKNEKEREQAIAKDMEAGIFEDTTIVTRLPDVGRPGSDIEIVLDSELNRSTSKYILDYNWSFQPTMLILSGGIRVIIDADNGFPHILLSDCSEVSIGDREVYGKLQIFHFNRIWLKGKIQHLEQRTVFLPWDKTVCYDVFDGIKVQNIP